MSMIESIIERANLVGITAKKWSKHDKLRIYAQTDRKDMSVFLELEGEEGDIDGGSFKVFCRTEQHPNWIKAQVAHFKKEYIGLWYSYVVEMHKEVPEGEKVPCYGDGTKKELEDARDFLAQNCEV